MISLLAQATPDEGFKWLLLLAAFVVLLLLSFIILMAGRFKRCPSNKILVIYGKVGGGNTSRCIHGGAAFVLPMMQDYEFLTLEPMQIEVPLSGALSIENIRVSVPSVFTVAIGTEPELMQNAAIRLLSLDLKKIQERVEHIIFGQLREVIASMRIEDIARHREQFLKNIQASMEPELRKIGLVLINVNITDITDESGYIVATGKKAASQAVQQALIDVAEQEKMGAIGVAEAEREKAVQVAGAQRAREIGLFEARRDQAVRVAELERDRQVGEQAAQRDQAVKVAGLDKDRKVAEQSAVYGRESDVKQAEQLMRIAVASANALAVAGEAAAKAQIAAAESELQIKQAEAYQAGETRKREAEAAVQEAQNVAMAKTALAEGQLVEAKRRAELEAPAKAEKAKMIVDAEAEAQKKRIEAEGEAAATFARLDAEARGQFEILAKKGLGLQQIIQACGGPEHAFRMLLLEHLDTLAETSAAAIANIKFDKVIVWENGSGGDSKGGTAGFLQSLIHAMPPMMQVLKDVGGVELPGYLGRLNGAGNGDGNGSAEPAAVATPGAGAGAGAAAKPAAIPAAPGRGDGSARK